VKTNLISKTAIAISDRAESFERALKASAQLLVAAGHAKAPYVDRVLDGYQKLGPYFVVAPKIAIAHASPGEDVLTPGLSLLKLHEGIASGVIQNDPVQLIFSLCTPDRDQHIELLGDFALLMSDKSIVNSLLNASAESVIWEILNN
jgi:ascorbate PTS system EIIA or EIIAB component